MLLTGLGDTVHGKHRDVASLTIGPPKDIHPFFAGYDSSSAR
jgi:hypothetical protein